MNSKTSFLAVVLLALGLPVCLRAQQATKPLPREVSSLLADYRKEYGKAKEPSDKMLRAEAAKIASKLVAEGKADGAKLINAQVEDKIAGKEVTADDATLISLFTRYDSTVVAAAKPIRDKFTSRADTFLKGAMGKDLAAVVALGEAKKIIAGELPAFDSRTDQPADGSMVANPARGRKVLSDLVEGKTWEFHTGGGDQLFAFDKRGSKVRWWRSGGNSPGTSEYNWSARDDSVLIGTDTCVLRFDISGSFGEVQFMSTKNKYRMTPSTRTIPAKK